MSKPAHGCEQSDSCVLDGDCPFFINCYLIEEPPEND